MAKLKVYGLTTFSRRVPGPANGSNQCNAVIASTSKKAAAEALGMNVYNFNQWASETGNALSIEIAMSDPGVVFLAPLDHGYRDASEWVRVPPGERP
ncbi:hypothetical protein [Aeromicrobium sp. 179-A 4D2 NHS]|uniref:hypothetical protein n=1 Tax=Aeromicrobium sp. 179-A 4D2 NHS TaxID=3142375 RepID=UPI0039A34D1B